MENFEITLTEDVTYTDRAFETASWYDRYTLKAGTYPIRASERYGSKSALVDFDAVLTETYRVSRVFSASKAHEEFPNREMKHTMQFRQESIVAGATLRIGSAVVTVVERAAVAA